MLRLRVASVLTTTRSGSLNRGETRASLRIWAMICGSSYVCGGPGLNWSSAGASCCARSLMDVPLLCRCKQRGSSMLGGRTSTRLRGPAASNCCHAATQGSSATPSIHKSIHKCRQWALSYASLDKPLSGSRPAQILGTQFDLGHIRVKLGRHGSRSGRKRAVSVGRNRARFRQSPGHVLSSSGQIRHSKSPKLLSKLGHVL